MLKISTRITLWYLSATGLVILLIGTVMYFMYKSQLNNSVDSELEDYSSFLLSGLGNNTSNLSDLYDELLKRKDEPLTRPRSHRFVLASNDSVVFETNAILNIDSLLDDLVEKNEFSYKTRFNTVTLNNVLFRTYSVPVKDSRGQTYQLLLFTSLDRVKDSLLRLRYILFLTMPLSLLAIGIIGFFIARRSFAPVHKITETADKITSSNLHERVPVGKSKDELSELAETFNSMITRLDQTFTSQRRFIADASHDIRTPLTIVMMELESLIQNNSIMPQTRDTVTRCINEMQRLNRLVDSLLFLARIDANMLVLNRKTIRLDETVFDVLAGFNNIARSRDITFDVNIDEAIEINADEDMFKRVLINLIDNAIKYSSDHSAVAISLAKTAQGVHLSVNNKGDIIPPDQLPLMFDRFRRNESSRTTDGFGLGLSIVKAIISAHNGLVTIHSQPDEGTTVDIQLNNAAQ